MHLRQWLIGAWALQSYSEQPERQGSRQHPLGADAKGMLIYSVDGWMSAMLMRAGRQPFASGDWFRSTPREIKAASAFIAYGGNFSVDEAARTVTHEIEISFFPNWIGLRQVRIAALQYDELTLIPAEPIMSGGNMVVPQLRWRRASAGNMHPAGVV